MSKKSSNIKKMVEDAWKLNNEARQTAVKAKKSIEKEIGLEITTESSQEYNDSDYFTEIAIVSVGDVEISA